MSTLLGRTHSSEWCELSEAFPLAPSKNITTPCTPKAVGAEPVANTEEVVTLRGTGRCTRPSPPQLLRDASAEDTWLAGHQEICSANEQNPPHASGVLAASQSALPGIAGVRDPRRTAKASAQQIP